MEVLIKLSVSVLENVIANGRVVIICGNYKVSCLIPVAVFVLNSGN